MDPGPVNPLEGGVPVCWLGGFFLQQEPGFGPRSGNLWIGNALGKILATLQGRAGSGM